MMKRNDYELHILIYVWYFKKDDIDREMISKEREYFFKKIHGGINGWIFWKYAWIKGIDLSLIFLLALLNRYCRWIFMRLSSMDNS